MEYNHITSFLEKFKKLLLQKEASQKTIAEIIEKHISYPVSTSTIKVRGTIVYLEGSPLLRSEILTHKQGIIADLEMTMSERRITDIR